MITQYFNINYTYVILIIALLIFLYLKYPKKVLRCFYFIIITYLVLFLNVFIILFILHILLYISILYKYNIKFKKFMDKLDFEYILIRMLTVKMFLFCIYVFSDFSYCDGALNSILGTALIKAGQTISSPTPTPFTVSLSSGTYLKIIGSCCLGVCLGGAVLKYLDTKPSSDLIINNKLDTLNTNIRTLNKNLVESSNTLKNNHFENLLHLNTALKSLMEDGITPELTQIQNLLNTHIAKTDQITETLTQTVDANTALMENITTNLINMTSNLSQNDTLLDADKTELLKIISELENLTKLQSASSVISTQLQILPKTELPVSSSLFSQRITRASNNIHTYRKLTEASKNYSLDELDSHVVGPTPMVQDTAIVNALTKTYNIVFKNGNFVFTPIDTNPIISSLGIFSQITKPFTGSYIFEKIVPIVIEKVVTHAINSPSFGVAASILSTINSMLGFSNRSSGFALGQETKETSKTVIRYLRDFVDGIQSKK